MGAPAHRSSTPARLRHPQDDKRDLRGGEGVVKMAGKIIRRAGGIHHQDGPVHPFSDDLAGELEPLLARSAEEVDIATVSLEPPEIEGMDVIDK